MVELGNEEKGCSSARKLTAYQLVDTKLGYYTAPWTMRCTL